MSDARVSGGDRSSGRRVSSTSAAVAICLSLAVLTTWLYWPALGCGFVNLDDNVYVTENDVVRAGLTADGLRWAFSFRHSDWGFYWQPLTWLSLMADSRIYGLDPAGFHLTNVLLHAANVLLLFLVLFRMTRAILPSAGVALLFAVHPLNVEAVAWVTERKHVLCTFLGLLCIGGFVLYTARPSARRYAASLLFLTASLLAKPLFVVMPLLLLLLDGWPLRRWAGLTGDRERATTPPAAAGAPLRSPRAGVVLDKAPFLVLGLLSSAATLWSLREAAKVEVAGSVPFALRSANAIVRTAGYLRHTLWPGDLAVLYPFPASLPALAVAGATLLLIAITATAVAVRRRVPAVLVGWLWFLVTLAPSLGLMQSGVFPAWADRFAYVPMIGLWVAMVWGCAALLPRARRPLLAAAVLGLAVGFAVRSREQLGYWRDSIRLFERALQVAGPNAFLYNNLAGSRVQQGQLAQAEADYRAGLTLDPHDANLRVGLSRVLLMTGRREEARGQLLAAAATEAPSAVAHIDLGNLLLTEGAIDAAAEEYGQAVAANPRNAGALYNLARTRHLQGRNREALDGFGQAVRLSPRMAAAWVGLAESWLASGRSAEATNAFREAVYLLPDDAALRLRLGTLLGEQGRFADAAVQLEAAVRLSPRSSEAHNNLGTAYLYLGRIEQAAARLEAAVRLRPANAEAHHNLSLAYRKLGRAVEADAAEATARRILAGGEPPVRDVRATPGSKEVREISHSGVSSTAPTAPLTRRRAGE